MIKINKALLVTSLLLPAFAYSGEAEVKWQNFDDYSDVRLGVTGKKKITITALSVTTKKRLES